MPRSLVRTLAISSLLGAIFVFPGCLGLIATIRCPSETVVDEEFAVAIDGSVTGHGGGVAALVVQLPDSIDFRGADLVSEHLRKPLRRHRAVEALYRAEAGHRVVALADSIPYARVTDEVLRVVLRLRARQTGEYTLKFSVAVRSEEDGRTVWRATDPQGSASFASITDARYARYLRVGAPARTGTAAISFQGKRSFVALPESDFFHLPLKQDFTAECWVRTTDLDCALLSNRVDDFTGPFGYELAVNAYGEPEVRCSDGRALRSTGRSLFMADGTWHHVALSWSADSLRFRLHLDGAPVAGLQADSGVRSVGPSPLVLAARPSRTYFFAGEIDELRFWSAARSTEEITWQKDLALSGFEGNLVALYAFDGGTGGRLPSSTEGEGLDAVAFNHPKLVSASTPLRIEVLAFDAVLDGEEVHLSWETYDEATVHHYTIERRSESGRYETLERIEPMRNPERHQVYDVQDPWSGKSVMYYRLWRVHNDGRSTASEEIPVGTGEVRDFTLGDNVPNPFSDSTIIPYTLLRRTQVSLAVYDLMGRMVEEIVSERQAAGSYEAVFRGSGLPPGMYFYKLRTSGASQTRKMYLAR